MSKVTVKFRSHTKVAFVPTLTLASNLNSTNRGANANAENGSETLLNVHVDANISANGATLFFHQYHARFVENQFCIFDTGSRDFQQRCNVT